MTIQTEAPPLRIDEAGGIRVGSSRVTLDCVMYAYKEGASAEEIAVRYDTLDLAAVYGAIAYYLRHTEEVEAYLKRREAEAEQLRAQIRANPHLQALRERIKARAVSKA